MITIELNDSGKLVATYTQNRARSINVTKWSLRDNKAHYLRGFGGKVALISRDEIKAIGNALREFNSK